MNSQTPNSKSARWVVWCLQLGVYLVFGVCCLVFFNAPMTALLLTLVVMLLAALAEWLHARRCRRVARLAFGPGGKARQWTRVVPALPLLSRIATDQARISIVAFYTDAKRVVVDTFDMEVVKNALNDLPLDLAFDTGKTKLLDGVRESAELAKPWQPDSATLVVVSDGDTIPDSGMPELPRSIQRTLVVGVGDARAGRFIDGHQSRQDFSTLRQLAGRLRGDYFDANEKHLPSTLLTALSKSLPLRDAHERGRRELALAAVGLGGFILAGLPLALALAGCAWQAGIQSKRAPVVSTRRHFADTETVNQSKPEKLTYA